MARATRDGARDARSSSDGAVDATTTATATTAAAAARATDDASEDASEDARDEFEEMRGMLERARAEARRAREETAMVKAELAVLRRSAKEAKMSADAAKGAADEASGSRAVLEARAVEAEEARERAEKTLDAAETEAREARLALDAALTESEEARAARADVERRLEVATARATDEEREKSRFDEIIRERDAALRASETANARSRSLESALAESREEQLRAEEEAMQLRRDLDESREERRRARSDGAISAVNDDGTSAGDVDRRRGQFVADEDIAAQQEEKYALLAELQTERRRRIEVEAELEDVINTQNDMNARAETASRIAAVAEGEADDYRARVSETEKATRAAKRSATAFESRAVKAESAIAAVKLVIGESEDAKHSDDELHLRVRAYVDRKTRRADAALADALEEAQLLRSKAKQMGESRVTDAASVDDRVLKLAEVRDKLVEEMNAQSAELERADAEIETRADAVAAARDEITDLELKLASSNAQNARLIEIIEEQGRWSAAEPSSGVSASSAARAAVSAPVTPVKSAPRRANVRRRDLAADVLGDRKALLARIEARLLEIHALQR